MQALKTSAGYVMIWTALLLTLLIAFVGFSVDFGNWNVHSDRLQSAADASALGGVVHMPGDLPAATTAAIEIAALHGYENGVNATVTVEQGDEPNQLRVEIRETVDNYFIPIIGIDTTEIAKASTTTYLEETTMGSPINTLGNNPESPDPQPQFWLALLAENSPKANGDRFSTRNCGGASVAGCTAGGSNLEFDEGGYFFSADVDVPIGETLRFQIFDGSQYDVGTVCGNSNDLLTAAEVANLAALPASYRAGASLSLADYYNDTSAPYQGERYLSGATPWCTGDIGRENIETTVTVRAPDDSPWDSEDNPVVSTSSCQPSGNGKIYRSFDPGAADAYELLNPLVGADTEHVIDPNDGVDTFAETFRRWHTFCEIDSGDIAPGSYIIQVQTNVVSGQSKFALRVGLADPVTPNEILDTGESLAAEGRLPIYANLQGANTEFFLARVPAGAAGKTLIIEMFDVGDANVPAQITILPPDEATAGDMGLDYDAFDVCSWFVTGGTSPTPNTAPATPCTLSGVQRPAYQGAQIRVDVEIPVGYDCDVIAALGCWVKVRVAYPPGNTVEDFTTWTVRLDGEPLRISE